MGDKPVVAVDPGPRTVASPPPPGKPAGTIARRRRRGRVDDTRAYKTFKIVNVVLLVAVIAATLTPFVNIIARSFSSEVAIRTDRVSLFPVGFNLHTYGFVIRDPVFWNSYKNTVYYTLVSTLVSLVLTTTYAYVLSKKHLKGRPFLVGIAVFTLFFNGGIIPNWILVNDLGMRNTVFALAVPAAINVFNLLVMKAFFENLPVELEEAAEVDGLSTYGMLLRIVLPLSKAVIATMSLFYAVAFWNSWFPALLYLDDPDMQPVTIYLRNLYSGATGAADMGGASSDLQISANVQAVTIVLISLPILMVYPFVQRYFVRGVMLGAVKG
jgi:putative aldouronate transport system permease protein